MSHFPFLDQAYVTMSAYNVYRATINLGITTQQTVFTTLPQMGNFLVCEVWMHIDSVSPDPSGVTSSLGTVATPTSLVNAFFVSPISLNGAIGLNTTVSPGVAASVVAPSTAVVYTRGGASPTSGSATLFVGGFYAGARDGR